MPIRRRPIEFATVLQALAWGMLVSLCVTASGCARSPEVVAAMPPEVSVSAPLARRVGEFFEATGQTVAVESVNVRARVPGYLSKVHFEEGADVNEGDLLFEIDPRPFQADLDESTAELAGATAHLKRSQADVDRTHLLLEKGAASLREHQAAVAMRDTAAAQIRMAQAHIDKANLQLEWSRVTAPISGRIGRANVTQGNLIQLTGQSSDILTSIVRTAPMYAFFDADERAMLRRQHIARELGRDPRPQNVKKLEIPVWMGLADESGFLHRGVVDFIDNKVDPSTGTIKIRAVFANEDASLTPGLFVRIRLPFGPETDALLVTDRAVGTDQGSKYLLVVNARDVVEFRPVTLGPMESDGLRVIREGIRPDERVIVNGLQRVRPGVTVRPRDVEMIVRAQPARPASTVAEDVAQPKG